MNLSRKEAPGRSQFGDSPQIKSPYQWPMVANLYSKLRCPWDSETRANCILLRILVQSQMFYAEQKDEYLN